MWEFGGKTTFFRLCKNSINIYFNNLQCLYCSGRKMERKAWIVPFHHILIQCGFISMILFINWTNDPISLVVSWFVDSIYESRLWMRREKKGCKINKNPLWPLSWYLWLVLPCSLDDSALMCCCLLVDAPTVSEGRYVGVTLGQRGVLECEADAVPEADFEWYKDDRR